MAVSEECKGQDMLCCYGRCNITPLRINASRRERAFCAVLLMLQAPARSLTTLTKAAVALQERQELRGADGSVCCFTVTLARPTVTFDDERLLEVGFSTAEALLDCTCDCC